MYPSKQHERGRWTSGESKARRKHCRVAMLFTPEDVKRCLYMLLYNKNVCTTHVKRANLMPPDIHLTN